MAGLSEALYTPTLAVKRYSKSLPTGRESEFRKGCVQARSGRKRKSWDLISATCLLCPAMPVVPGGETRTAGGEKGLGQVRHWPRPLKGSPGFMLGAQKDYSVVMGTFGPHLSECLNCCYQVGTVVLTEQRGHLRLRGASCSAKTTVKGLPPPPPLPPSVSALMACPQQRPP